MIFFSYLRKSKIINFVERWVRQLSGIDSLNFFNAVFIGNQPQIFKIEFLNDTRTMGGNNDLSILRLRERQEGVNELSLIFSMNSDPGGGLL